MKRIMIAFIAVMFSTITAAQEIDLGIKAGVNFASINDISGDADGRTGFVAGAFVGFKLGDKLGLQGDVLYSQQGAKFDVGEFNLDYVNVPIVLKYFVTENLNIQAGPQFGFVAKDDFKSDLEEIALADPNSTDITGVIGVGFDLPFGLIVDGRYNFGLSEVFKDVEGDAGKNAVVTLSVGYSFL